jgi:hypothetical protein
LGTKIFRFLKVAAFATVASLVVDGASVADAPSPAGTAPKSRIAWVRTIPGGGNLQPYLVVTSARIAFTAEATTFMLNRLGQLVGKFSGKDHEVLSSPTAYSPDRIYMVADESSVYGLDEQCQVVWKHRFGAPTTAREFVRINPPVVSPRGFAYVAGADGYIHGFRTKDGLGDWRRASKVDDLWPPAVIVAGTADSIFALRSGSSTQSHLLRYPLDIGRQVLPIGDEALKVSAAFLADKANLVMFGYTEVNSRSGTTEVSVRDSSGLLRWRAPPTVKARPQVVGRDGRIYLTERDADNEGSPMRVVQYSASGERMSQRTLDDVAMVRWTVLGRDNRLYLVVCSGEESEVISVAGDLASHAGDWRQPLQGQCPQGVALADDGMLYLSRQSQNSGTKRLTDVDVIAIKTSSLGVARTAWPAPRHDSEGRAWFEQ